jgi:hypothetical protein
MDLEQIHARHLVELGHLEEIFTDMGYGARLVERSRDVPYHTLLVDLVTDAWGRPQQMALTFYPVGEDEVKHTLLLQYFIELPFQVNSKELAQMREVLLDINSKVVLGHFGITPGQNKLHYRYVQTLPLDRIITGEAVADVILLVNYTPILFAEILEEFAEKRISLEQAKAKVAARYSEK